MSPRPAASYYEASARPAPAHPPLQGEAACDICVTGAGIAGLSAALELVERGHSVVVLEAERVGAGASGRSGGQILPGVATGQAKLEQLVGREDARRIWDVSVEGARLVRERIARYGIACDWMAGQMQVAMSPRQIAELQAEESLLRERYGYGELRHMDRAEVEDVLATRRYVAGLYDGGGGHLHPLDYTRGLAVAAVRAGVRIFEGSRMLRYERGAAGIRVHTARGVVSCRALVLCGNAMLGAVAPPLARKILPVATYIVATEPLGEARARALVANGAAVTDMNWILDYFRLSADHRLLFGGRVSYSGVDPLGTRAATRRRMLAVFPQLADVRIDYAWGGLLDITRNRAPHFGRLEPDVYFVQGFSGHGLALAGVAGRLVAEAVAGTAERFDVFARIPHRDFPGGPALRRPALVLAMLWYRLRDLL